MLLEIVDFEQDRVHAATVALAAKWQAAKCAGAFSSSAGATRRHRSRANAQRLANTQPATRCLRFGTTPGISANLVCAAASEAPSLGTALSRPRVYGCRGERNSSATGASSTLRPAYITMTRSAISATTPRSWVMRMMAAPTRCLRSVMRLRICAWMVTSSAVVGSSAIRSFGRQASAMAHAAGQLVRILARAPARLGDADKAEHLHHALLDALAAEPLMQPQGFGDLTADGENRIEARHRLLE